MLDRIRNQYAQLTPAERKVADIVLHQPNEFVQAPVADIARNAGVSQPTVIRFSRSVGCSGLQDLKLKLAGSLVGGVPYVHANVRPEDTIPEISAKVFDNAISALLKCRNEVSPQSLETAIRLIANARRLEFHGLGNSGIIAADAQHKFFRFDIPSVAYVDPHIQAMAATLLGPKDVLVAISNSGRTNELLDAVNIALANGCKVVAITSPRIATRQVGNRRPLGRRSRERGNLQPDDFAHSAPHSHRCSRRWRRTPAGPRAHRDLGKDQAKLEKSQTAP